MFVNGIYHFYNNNLFVVRKKYITCINKEGPRKLNIYKISKGSFDKLLYKINKIEFISEDLLQTKLNGFYD